MSWPEDGGPAFPSGNGGLAFAKPGMSLRDHFAGLALAGILADTNYDPPDPPGALAAAILAYHIADAMLKARSEADPPQTPNPSKP